MHLKYNNVNDAFRGLVEGFHTGSIPTVKMSSRNGKVLMIQEPVIVTYLCPTHRVLFNAARDANPFMHVYEALWMLAGRDDVAPLAYYAKQFREYSDDGETLNGAYGYRWRHAKTSLGDDSVGPDNFEYDQLDLLVDHLKANPESRRAVLQMWNVEDDLLKIGGGVCKDCEGRGYIPAPENPADGKDCKRCKGIGKDPGSRDVCCNLSVMFSLRTEREAIDDIDTPHLTDVRYLDMTVTNRSNDLLWGALGANVVHFSFLQEALAARLGVEVGVYNQFSNNLHVYCDRKDWKPKEMLAEASAAGSDAYSSSPLGLYPLVRDPEVFERELSEFVEFHSKNPGAMRIWKEPFLDAVVEPMLTAYHLHKSGRKDQAMMAAQGIAADDWRIAAEGWLERRRR